MLAGKYSLKFRLYVKYEISWLIFQGRDLEEAFLFRNSPYAYGRRWGVLDRNACRLHRCRNSILSVCFKKAGKGLSEKMAKWFILQTVRQFRKPLSLSLVFLFFKWERTEVSKSHPTLHQWLKLIGLTYGWKTLSSYNSNDFFFLIECQSIRKIFRWAEIFGQDLLRNKKYPMENDKWTEYISI